MFSVKCLAVILLIQALGVCGSVVGADVWNRVWRVDF